MGTIGQPEFRERIQESLLKFEQKGKDVKAKGVTTVFNKLIGSRKELEGASPEVQQWYVSVQGRMLKIIDEKKEKRFDKFSDETKQNVQTEKSKLQALKGTGGKEESKPMSEGSLAPEIHELQDMPMEEESKRTHGKLPTLDVGQLLSRIPWNEVPEEDSEVEEEAGATGGPLAPQPNPEEEEMPGAPPDQSFHIMPELSSEEMAAGSAAAAVSAATGYSFLGVGGITGAALPRLVGGVGVPMAMEAGAAIALVHSSRKWSLMQKLAATVVGVGATMGIGYVSSGTALAIPSVRLGIMGAAMGAAHVFRPTQRPSGVPGKSALPPSGSGGVEKKHQK